MQYLHDLIPIVPSLPTVNWGTRPPQVTEVRPRSLWNRISSAMVYPKSPLPEIDETRLLSSETDEMDVEIGRMLDEMEDTELVESLTDAERDVVEHVCAPGGMEEMLFGSMDGKIDIEWQ